MMEKLVKWTKKELRKNGYKIEEDNINDDPDRYEVVISGKKIIARDDEADVETCKIITLWNDKTITFNYYLIHGFEVEQLQDEEKEKNIERLLLNDWDNHFTLKDLFYNEIWGSKMSNEIIAQILKLHSINYRIDDAGRIFAEEVYTINANAYSDFINVTGWSKKRLLFWLGY